MQRKTNIDPKKKAFRDLMLDALDNEILSQKKSVCNVGIDLVLNRFYQVQMELRKLEICYGFNAN